MMVKEKCTASFKGRLCSDGQKQQGTIEKDKAASLTVGIDSVFVTAAIKAAKDRNVVMVNLPGNTSPWTWTTKQTY